MVIRTEVFAKPGELIQGLLPDNKYFMLSNKSSKIFKSITTIYFDKNRVKNNLNAKSSQAIELFKGSFKFRDLSIPIEELSVVQTNNIPLGKGLSSSSADILGVLHGLNIFYKTSYSIQEIYTLATSIEPTDPCLHEDSLLFNQRSGEIFNSFGKQSFNIIYFDSDIDQTIDTIEAGRLLNYSEGQKKAFESLFRTIENALKSNDNNSFFNCLIQSAEMNNAFFPKKNFETLREFALANKCGVFIAHTGSFMGLVIEKEKYRDVEQEAIEMIKENWGSTIYCE